MEPMSIPLAGRIILAALFIIVLVCFLLNSKKWYCWKHFCYKTLKGFFSTDDKRYCEQCIHEQMNPKLKCLCGWKGSLGDCNEVIEDDMTVFYNCPICELPISI